MVTNWDGLRNNARTQISSVHIDMECCAMLVDPLSEINEAGISFPNLLMQFSHFIVDLISPRELFNFYVAFSVSILK